MCSSTASTLPGSSHGVNPQRVGLGSAILSILSGERLVAPLRAAGPVLMDTLGDLSYTESGSISNDPPFAHAYTGTSAMLDELDVATAFDLAGPGAAVPCVLQVRHLGGALTRPSAAVIGHRDARYALHVVSGLDGLDGLVPATSRKPTGI
ncbi:hypothetical protein [Streptosporangium sp. NPDC000396]|uniref:hypothetical protein n=1 Tax=Streptosporangium sp. NPDC000396 TaxID=3366185 RepID=UPI0036A6A7B9